MDETVFFNLGNSIASSKDEKELIRIAQIEHDKRKSKGLLVIVKDSNSGEHLLFDFSDVEEESPSTRKFKVQKIIEEK